jgi:hypothetical protein
MGDHVEVKQYRGTLSRLKDGLEPVKPDDRNYAAKGSKNTEILKHNIYRSYGQLLEYAFVNGHYFKTFVTLTFADNIKDLDYANSQFRKCMKAIRRKNPDFMYLGVPEFQKRGAVHYHIMTNIPIDDLRFIVQQKGQQNKYDFILWKHGFTSVFDLSLADEKFSVALYLTKYFYKDVDSRLFGRNKILKSNNLKKAQVREFMADSDEYNKYIEYLENTYNLTKEKNIESANIYVPAFVVKLYKHK